tara:strand:- start:7974 stop:8234 length:261 start_codon:yes stop_codon:yes gene_type:complete
MFADTLGKWILVVDTDAYSKEQMQICMRIKPPIKGVEDCSRSDANGELCRETRFFPSFCHEDTKACVAGLRTTRESFVELGELKTR